MTWISTQEERWHPVWTDILHKVARMDLDSQATEIVMKEKRMKMREEKEKNKEEEEGEKDED